MKKSIKKSMLVASVAIFSFVCFQSFNHSSFNEPLPVKCRKALKTDYCVVADHSFKMGCANSTATDDCKSDPVQE